jgi:hypothetical protein
VTPPQAPEIWGIRAFDRADPSRTPSPESPHNTLEQVEAEARGPASPRTAVLTPSPLDKTPRCSGELPSCPIPQGQIPHPHPQLATTALLLKEKTRYQVELTPSARIISPHECQPSVNREEITYRDLEATLATTGPRDALNHPTVSLDDQIVMHERRESPQSTYR